MAAEILNLEALLEETRNKRQEFASMFENVDKKVTQLFNILSTVMKSIKKMKSSVIRNISWIEMGGGEKSLEYPLTVIKSDWVSCLWVLWEVFDK